MSFMKFLMQHDYYVHITVQMRERSEASGKLREV